MQVQETRHSSARPNILFMRKRDNILQIVPDRRLSLFEPKPGSVLFQGRGVFFGVRTASHRSCFNGYVTGFVRIRATFFVSLPGQMA
jgi:hypothetical protein